MMSTNYVIVVGILEGKNFPVRPDKYLLGEAKFNGEVMSTDVVPHVQQPKFRMELGWEVDKNGLKTHRLQHSPIKLQWFALDIDYSRKETIGYMVLDIRLAQPEQLQHPKWHPLLNSKYQKEKPEVQLVLYLDKVTQDSRVGTPSSRRSSIDRHSYRRPRIDSRIPKPSPSKSSSHSQNRNQVLKPVLLPQSACYQIGPTDLCTEMYSFSVILTFAGNLNKLQPPAMLRSSKGFYFYYSLLENDVRTETFSSLASPQFQPERASVKIYSSPKLLAEYFELNPNLEILLCCGDISLGSSLVVISPLACVIDRDIHQEPIIIEGCVQIVPVEKTSRIGGDDFPFASVTISLESVMESHSSKNEDVVSTWKSPKCQPDLLPKILQNPSENVSRQSSAEKDESRASRETSPPTRDNGTSVPLVTDISTTSSSDTSPRDGGPFIQPLSTLPIGNSEPLLQFSFALDLCHFMATRLSQSINLFIRYSYPFFGTNSSMITHPDIEVNQKRKVSIPHGYCVFNFTTTHTLLKSTFWETPLILEVLHRKKGGMEQLVGSARVNLFQVLSVQSVSHTVDKQTGMRQMTKSKVVVTSQEEYEIGEIDSVLTLINFGPTSLPCDHHHANKASSSCFNEARNCIPTFPMTSVQQNGLIIQDDRLQAALELGLWQDRQREIFRAQLKDKEMQHLAALNAQFKEQDMERDILFQKQLQECRKLETKLKMTLKDADLKEKQLSSLEDELTRRQQLFDSQQEQQQKDTRNKIETLKMEFNELLSFERIKVRDLEQTNSHLKHQLKDLDRDLQDQKKLVEKLRSQISKDPDFHLRTEVNILNMEKAELQQKLETALSSKQKYKLQWGQAVRQMSMLQQRLHAMECAERERRERISAHQKMQLEDKSASRLNEEMLDERIDSSKNLPLEVSKQQQVPSERHSTSHSSGDAVSTNADAANNSENLSTNLSSKPLTTIPNGITAEKPNTHGKVSRSENYCTPPNKPSSLIPKPIHRDLNDNAPSRSVQSILSEKQNLLEIGYTERHSAIQEFNAHLEKLTIK